MGYKVLVTLNLPKITGSQRDVFYTVLDNENWSKIPSLTASWRVSFADSVGREAALATIQALLLKAKNESNVKRVDYALQLDKSEIIVAKLSMPAEPGLRLVRDGVARLSKLAFFNW
jgi:hypothetical protein